MENNQQRGNAGGGVPLQGGYGPQPGYGPQQQPGYGPQPNYGPGPQQPYPPQGYPQRPMNVMPKKPMDEKTKKLIILICSIGGGLLVLGIAALIVLPILFKVDYEETYKVADDLWSAVSELDSPDACKGLVNQVASTYTSREAYNKLLEGCNRALADVKTHTEAVSATSGLRDGELKELWDIYKTNYERLAPVYEKLAKVYPVWHDFVANEDALKKGDDWYKTVTESRLEGLVQPLAESEIEAFKNYAKGYKEKYVPYVMAYKQQDLMYETWLDTRWNAPNYNETRDTYYAARDATTVALDAWNRWKGDNSVDLSMEVLLGIDLDKSENRLAGFFNNFYSNLHTKYLETAIKGVFGV